MNQDFSLKVYVNNEGEISAFDMQFNTGDWVVSPASKQFEGQPVNTEITKKNGVTVYQSPETLADFCEKLGIEKTAVEVVEPVTPVEVIEAVEPVEPAKPEGEVVAPKVKKKKGDADKADK